MDCNTVIISGRIAAPVERRTFDSGSTLIRVLVTVKTDKPRKRVDVLPVQLWTDDYENDAQAYRLVAAPVGNPIFVTGAIQRRFWESNGARTSRIEIVATSVSVAENTEEGIAS